MAKLKLFYSRDDGGVQEDVWLTEDTPIKSAGAWRKWDGEGRELNVVWVLPHAHLGTRENDHLLRLLRPPGIRKGQCWEITVKVEKKRKNKP